LGGGGGGANPPFYISPLPGPIFLRPVVQKFYWPMGQLIFFLRSTPDQVVFYASKDN
jgi:hypothetical protein